MKTDEERFEEAYSSLKMGDPYIPTNKLFARKYFFAGCKSKQAEIESLQIRHRQLEIRIREEFRKEWDLVNDKLEEKEKEIEILNRKALENL